METMTDIKITNTNNSKLSEVDFENIEFGKHISDHMLVANCYHDQWHEPEIVPFANLSLSPATLALHYGQTVFEGMKAFKMKDGRINIFRLDKHYDRFNRSLHRMCMSEIPYEIFVEGMKQLIALDKNWVPEGEGTALYIRPFMFASEARFGVNPSNEYQFIIYTGPVGRLFSKPIKVKIELEYIRAAKGGTGSVKCGGNYGGSLYPAKLAKELGYDNVIWTDAKDHKFIEESGVMNMMLVVDGVLLTPPTSNSILDGVTRDSLLTLARDMNINVEERPISVDEIKDAFKKNLITAAFGVGTAAVVSPIDTIGIDGVNYKIPGYTGNNIMYQIKNKLDTIRYGIEEDIYGWNFIVS